MVLAVLLVFPIIVFFLSEQEDISSQDKKKAEEYFTDAEISVVPCTKEDGGKYTIAYVDIDPYPASGEMLYYFVERLREEGWIDYDGELPFEASQTDARQVRFYYKGLEETFKELAESGDIDAFMLNTDMIKDEKRIKKLLEIFYRKNIPVFVQNGEYYVEFGAFMVVTASDAKVQAPFAVDAFAKILNGRKPEEVYQKFVTPPYLSINLEVAERLGYQV